MKTVVIDRKSWKRGEYCSKAGKCCAIGFIAKAELKRQGIKKPTPLDITSKAIKLNLPNKFNIIDINDPPENRGKKRIELLRKEFAKAGYRLVVVN